MMGKEEEAKGGWGRTRGRGEGGKERGRGREKHPRVVCIPTAHKPDR